MAVLRITWLNGVYKYEWLEFHLNSKPYLLYFNYQYVCIIEIFIEIWHN